MFEKMRQLEKGQALLEYVATFPASIMVGIVVGAALGPGVSNVYRQVLVGFEREVVVDCEPPSANTFATPGGHEIEVVDNTFDGEGCISDCWQD